MVCLSRPYHYKFVNVCFPEISPGPFLNTLTHMINQEVIRLVRLRYHNKTRPSITRVLRGTSKYAIFCILIIKQKPALLLNLIPRKLNSLRHPNIYSVMRYRNDYFKNSFTPDVAKERNKLSIKFATLPLSNSLGNLLYLSLSQFAVLYFLYKTLLA